MHHPVPKAFLFILAVATATFSSAQTFKEVSQAAGITHFDYSPSLIGGGAAFFDYDNDGWQDIYIIGGLTRDKLYHNNGNGTFTERGLAAGLYADGLFYTMGVVTGDIDNDGDRDIFVTTWGDSNDWAIAARNLLYRNNGNGTFTDIALSAGITQAAWSVSACMGDYNLDGYLDIYVENYVEHNSFIRDSVTNEIIGFAHTGYPNYFYLNNGNNTFTDIAPQLHLDNRGVTLGGTFTDYDNDHDPDIYVVNDFGAWTLPNALFRNAYPVDSFTDVSVAAGANAGIYGMGIAPGDYDEDGDLDYYITNIGRRVLYRNNGNGTFTDVADSAGVTNTYTDDSLLTTGWGTAFFDYDNDTWLDLFVSNGQIPAASIIATGLKDPDKLFKNNRNGTFTDVSGIEGVSDSARGRGFITGDYDNDGDMDMLVVNASPFAQDTARVMLYRNDQSTGRHWLKVKVQGTVNSRDAFGTRVEVHAGGRKWIREIDGGSSHASQNSSVAHFGLANYTLVDSLVVIWPGGARAVLPQIAVDQLVSVVEQGPSTVYKDVFVESCEGDSIFAGGTYQTTSGIYHDTLLAAGGIDSIVTMHLTFFQNKLTTLNYTVCADDSILLNGVYFYGDTILTDSLTTAQGCDSIVITNVTLRPWQFAIVDAFICAGDSVLAGGAWQTEPGSYYDSIPGGSICDYILITALQVIPAIAPDTQQVFICAGDSLFAGGAYQTLAGFYADTFQTSFGCDSLVFTHLSVGNQLSGTSNLMLCAGDSFFIAGQFQTEAGTYLDTLISAGGCDSLLIYNLIFDSVFVSETRDTIFAGDSLFVGANWQTAPGFYIDTFTNANGCDSILRTELIVRPVGVHDVSRNDFGLMVYPNPSNLSFTITFTIPDEETVSVKLFDVSGKEVLFILDELKNPGTYNLKVTDTKLAPGMYLLVFRSSSYSKELKVILY